MPTKEGYEYADVAHEKVTVDATFKYGCHSDKLGEGWRGVKPWIEMPCGHMKKTRDKACDGCSNQHQPD